MIKEIIMRRAPDPPCCISFEVLLEIKSTSASTTVINTRVSADCHALFRQSGGRARALAAAALLLMQSNGGPPRLRQR
jgi:N-methylhydantoinase A/oxoprolinase/acetone carboxylase beta subunit